VQLSNLLRATGSVDAFPMSTTDGLKAIHDQLLADMPEGAEHDEATCPMCALEVEENTTPGGSMPETFTQEDLDAAVTAMSDTLQQRLKELEAQVQESEVGRAVAQATEAKDAEISQLQQRIDAAEASRTAAENKLNEVEQFWVDAIATQQAASELDARKERRVTEAKQAGVFSDDYINENAERFAAMSDEDFSARLEEWRLIAAKTGESTPAPARTALAASASGQTPPASNLSVVSELRGMRVDPRTLGGVS
jgi:DNA repair exonuclease SbcCD ATPase subunit